MMQVIACSLHKKGLNVQLDVYCWFTSENGFTERRGVRRNEIPQVFVASSEKNIDLNKEREILTRASSTISGDSLILFKSETGCRYKALFRVLYDRAEVYRN